MTTVLKLGGSAITDKTRPETVDEATLERVGTALGDVDPGEELVVVHGGGSFGHHHAQRHGVSASTGTTDPVAITEIHAAMTALNDAVLEPLHDHGVAALPVRPLSVARRDSGLELPTGGIEAMLAEGFVPVLHGDVVIDGGQGATILSGDEVVVSVARSLSADRVGLCSTVPGVLDDDGGVLDRIESFEAVRSLLGAADGTDVTGGMAGKVRALLELSTPAHVFGIDGLAAFLSGGSPGTTIDAADP